MKQTGNRLASADPSPAPAAALIGDPVRAAMLCALLDRGELSAGELAYRARVAPNAASAHLAKLVSGRLITVRTLGRQRLFALASGNVARALEALSVLAPPVRVVGLSQARIAEDLQAARSCYDHLAGRLGVAVTEALVDRGMLVPARDSAYRLTAAGTAFCAALSISVSSLQAERRHFARQCMDWSERRPHLAGALGAALRTVLLENGWVECKVGSRAMRLTPAGMRWLRATLAIELRS
ncbi:MAG: winged helix-turn-helix domain-containing protein [Candidatus Eremiobacteraeota bacterium]|nr:winged helix-turn-helix domain-containing protein [Candidatus Eremiobacteraeota bacterium]